MKVAAKYTLLQIPGWLLAASCLTVFWSWAVLETSTAILLFLAWLAKDALLYPLVREAYESPPRTGTELLVGARAIARQPLAPRGYVQLGAEIWRAQIESGAPFVATGRPVKVVASRGLTLIVVPEETASGS